MTYRVLTHYVPDNSVEPKNWLFLMDADDPRLMDGKFQIIDTNVYLKDAGRTLWTETSGDFHVATDWSVTPITFKKARKN